MQFYDPILSQTNLLPQAIVYLLGLLFELEDEGTTFL
jgi:hypothetical protein